MEVKICSISDLAKELSRRYHSSKEKTKRGEKGDLFNTILKNLFNEYGEKFGNSDIHFFKSDVVRAKNMLKNDPSAFEKSRDDTQYTEEEFWDDVKLKAFYNPREGDGAIFTKHQIEKFGLNPDSY